MLNRILWIIFSRRFLHDFLCSPQSRSGLIQQLFFTILPSSKRSSEIHIAPKPATRLRVNKFFAPHIQRKNLPAGSIGGKPLAVFPVYPGAGQAIAGVKFLFALGVQELERRRFSPVESSYFAATISWLLAGFGVNFVFTFQA